MFLLSAFFMTLTLAAYSPSTEVTRFHLMPRFKGAPNTISTDIYIPSSAGGIMDAFNSPRNAYLVGAAGPGVALIIAAIVFIVCYTFAYLCACCRCCGCCGNSNKVRRRGKTGVYVVMVLCAIANLGLILSGIAALPGFVKGVDGLLEGTAKATGLMESASKLLVASDGFVFTRVNGTSTYATSVFQSLQDATFDANTMLTIAQNTEISPGSGLGNICNNPVANRGGSYADADAFCAALSTLASSLGAAASSSSGAASPLSMASTQFGAISTTVPLDQAKSQVFLAGCIVLAVIAGVIAIQSVLLCRTYAACCLFKSFAWVSVLLTALVFVLAGLFFIIGLPGSDVCYAPGTTLNTLVGGMDQTGTLTYYLTCSSDSTIPFPSALGVNGLDSAKTAIGTAQSQIVEMTTKMASGGFAPRLGTDFTSATDRLVSRLPSAMYSLDLLRADVLSCPSISGVFDSFYGGLCGGFVTSSITLATVLTAAAALLVLQMSLGVEVCCRHPGDVERWDDPSADAAAGSELQLRKVGGKAPMQGVSINSA